MPPPNEDPALTSSRREAIVVTIACVVTLLYTVGYCYLYGYGRSLDDLKFVLGFPDWVFWGVVIPWAACVLFSLYFGSAFMRDEYLGDDPEGSDEGDFFEKEGKHAG